VKAICDCERPRIVDTKAEVDKRLVVLYEDMKIAFRRAEQGIKSKTQIAKIDASTTEVKRSTAKVGKIIKAIPKRSARNVRHR
jgi:hypothetical protein